jgi:hypothetical protein
MKDKKMLNRTTTKPPTEKQLAHQMKWKTASQFAAKCADALILSKQYNKKKRWGRSILMRQLMNTAIVGTYPDIAIDYSKVAMSNGFIGMIWNFKGCLSETGCLKIIMILLPGDWHGEISDTIILCLYNSDTNTAQCFEQEINHYDSEFSIQIPSYQSGSQYHLWLFEASKASRLMGETYYIKLATSYEGGTGVRVLSPLEIYIKKLELKS